MRYTVVAIPSEDGAGYVAYVPAIPGCVTAGADLAEALAMAQDAAAAMLAVAAERREEIPTAAPAWSSPRSKSRSRPAPRRHNLLRQAIPPSTSTRTGSATSHPG